MKIKIIKAFCLTGSRRGDVYLLQIKFIEGNKILPNDIYIDEDKKDISFIVKSLPIGGFNESEASFPIEIQKPNYSIAILHDKIFVKQ